MYLLLSILQIIVAIISVSIALYFGPTPSFETIPIALFACFFGFAIWYNINMGKCYFKLLNLGKTVRKKPSNKKVKEYISYLEGRKSVLGYPNTWGSLRETYRQVSAQEKIEYNLKLQLFEALSVKRTRGINAPRKSGKSYSEEEREEKIRQAGEEGERQVEHALDWLDKERFKVFSDIRLPYGGKSLQFDTIVVGDNGIFNIETKNFIGDLSIDEEGNWYRTVGNNKIGTENVNFQIRRHNKVLNSLLEDNFQ